MKNIHKKIKKLAIDVEKIAKGNPLRIQSDRAQEILCALDEAQYHIEQYYTVDNGGKKTLK